jgi:SAM-dependent methyltransferase
MMKPLVSIIIPTFNNPQFLNPCIDSIIQSGVLTGLAELVIINNGKQPIQEYVKNSVNVRVLEPGRNLGWEHGLQYGLDNTDSEYVCFQNDDTLIPKATQNFYQQLLWPFNDTTVGAVGPATTVAAGLHSVYQKNPVRCLVEVPFLIFFTVMVRRADLIAAGGIDTSCPGGDDMDLSIRLRKMGKRLLLNPDAFIIHHAFKTGERVRGGPDVAGGWNSKEMTEKTNQWLIQKHGFKTFMETMRGFNYQHGEPVDTEGEAVARHVRGPVIYELGCGFRKTVPQAVGIDAVEKGKPCNHLNGPPSVADITADVTKPLPINDLSADTLIARHILEHCLDPVVTLKNWNKVLKMEGRILIAVPNHELRNTIPLNPEHVHGYTPEALKNLMELCGFKQLEVVDPKNGISFIGVFEKVLHMAQSENGKVLEVAGV